VFYEKHENVFVNPLQTRPLIALLKEAPSLANTRNKLGVAIALLTVTVVALRAVRAH